MDADFAYIKVPEIGLYVDPYRAKTRGITDFEKSWYNVKLWTQENGNVLLTSRQLSQARDYFEKDLSSISETLLVQRELETVSELTDSIIAFPAIDGTYPHVINPNPKPGKWPLLIEGSVVELKGSKKEEKYYMHHDPLSDIIVDGGTRTELPELTAYGKLISIFDSITRPWYMMILNRPIPELGLKEDTRVLVSQYPPCIKPVTHIGFGLNNMGNKTIAAVSFTPHEAHGYCDHDFRRAVKNIKGTEKIEIMNGVTIEYKMRYGHLPVKEHVIISRRLPPKKK
ncbi:MAG: hypothetical protein NT129_03260 [Candidatus Aenigmarchaeota archaeon]|nr:hypothetical protein [Candidatus Aenigmarchaeota archaeon]